MMKLLLKILVVFMPYISWSQDPNYSQFFVNEVYFNPALTGINNGLRLGMNYRNLWTPVPSRLNNAMISVDGAGVNKMGLGLMVSSDNEGEGMLRTYTAGGSYSYRVIEARNMRLQLGVNGMYVRKQIDWAQLVFSDQLDEVFGNVNGSSFILPAQDITQYVDFSAGAAFKFNAGSKNDYTGKTMTGTVGVAAHHLSQPQDAFIGAQSAVLPLKLVVHGELKINSPVVVYAPAFIYQSQTTMSTFQMGLNFSKVSMFGGLWFRNMNPTFSPDRFDSFIFNFGIFKKDKNDVKYKIGYSYDFTISRLKSSSLGSHELALTIEWSDKFLFAGSKKRKAKNAKYRFIPCTDY